MYKLTSNSSIIRVSDGAHIPINAQNRDYQAYLTWVREGNMPLPADIDENALVIGVETRALELLLKLVQPTEVNDIALKNELLNKLTGSSVELKE